VKRKGQLMNKSDLMNVGFTESTASEIIRCVKTQLAREGLGLYNNPRIGVVPTERIIEFLIGESGKQLSSQETVEFLKDEIIHRDELIKRGIPKATANYLIKQAQQTMTDVGFIFYKNTRRWYAPTKMINQLLGGK